MRISELGRVTGVPVATVKYYLREGLVHPGRATGATQAQYDQTHVARLRLARALVQVGGLSIVSAREVMTTLDQPEKSLHEVLGTVHDSLPPQPDHPGTPRAQSLVEDLGWQVRPEATALRQLEQALRVLEEVGAPASEQGLQSYARLARQIAELDVASVPRASPDDAATAVIVGTVLWEPLLLALRRLAQEAVSAESLDGHQSRPDQPRP
ncbi:MerR family transcriptional regulator [Desertihabitans aurantiacus]|uniref:MerR family transcriptional regulator n=1 Tax=Desertihabitans aurantiacus TaxID=2282477 RepID=UPI0013001A41|nr:MerR family transcriptional regulator [Desertihabitans aurantiacus]